MRIRKFRKEDAIQASRVIRKGFRESNASYYGKESIESQIKENSPKKLIEKSKRIHYFVAVEKGQILGIGGYNAKTIRTFFVDPQFHRKGIGRQIMQRVLAEAEKVGISSLDAWSTFHAVKFYSRCGFKKIKKVTFHGKDGLPIAFVLMRKRLQSSES